MAVLTSQERHDVFSRIMRWWSNNRVPCSFTKPNLQAAIADEDDALEASIIAAIAGALPEPFASNSTAVQKVELVIFILVRRAKVLGSDLPFFESS